MSQWITCKSVADTDKFIYVNLDQVVCMMDNALGVEMTYAGSESTTFVVEGKAFDILARAGIVPSA